MLPFNAFSGPELASQAPASARLPSATLIPGSGYTCSSAMRAATASVGLVPWVGVPTLRFT
jgi:hypothetical protein